MNKTLTIAISLALSSSVYAGKPEHKPPHQAPPVSTEQAQKQYMDNDIDNMVIVHSEGSDAASSAKSKSASNSKSISNSESISDSKSISNSESTSQNDLDLNIEGDVYDIPVNTAYAPGAIIADCSGTLGIGSTRADGSFSVGVREPRWLSRQIRDCERRNDAMWLQSAGFLEESINARCMTKSMQELFKGSKNCKDILNNKVMEARIKQDKIKILSHRIEELEERNEKIKQTCIESDSRVHKACQVK